MFTLEIWSPTNKDKIVLKFNKIRDLYSYINRRCNDLLRQGWKEYNCSFKENQYGIVGLTNDGDKNQMIFSWLLSDLK